MKQKKLPLNDVLLAIDNHNLNYYSNLTDEDKKQFNSWLMMRFASSVNGPYAPHYLMAVNEFVNKDYQILHKHTELVWKLLCVCGVGKKQFHPWIKAPKSRVSKDKISEFILSLYPTMKRDEVELFKKVTPIDELIDLAKKSGLNDKEAEELAKSV